MSVYVIEFAKTGLSPTFDEFRKVSDGSAVTPPTISALIAGSRFYQFTYAPTERMACLVNPNDVQVADKSFEISNFDYYVPSTFLTLMGTLSAGVIPSFTTVVEDADVVIYRGDVVTLTFNLGTTWNLTGKFAYFIAKDDPKADNSTAIVNRATTITDAVNGQCNIVLTALETAVIGDYFAEVEVRDDPGNTTPQTARKFNLIIRQDVRQ